LIRHLVLASQSRTRGGGTVVLLRYERALARSAPVGADVCAPEAAVRVGDAIGVLVLRRIAERVSESMPPELDVQAPASQAMSAGREKRQ
jgi:hypothetical protein